MKRSLSLAIVVVLTLLLVGATSPPAGASATLSGLWQAPWSQWNTLNAVDFVDASQGWAVGDAGTIIHSSDGGVTWSGQTSGTDVGLTGVSFADVDHGWAVGAGGTILVTADGGATWTAEPSGTTVNLTDVAFADDLHGCVVGDNTTFLRTEDGGATWTLTTGVEGWGGDAVSLNAVSLVDSSHGWASGNYYDFINGWHSGRVSATLDGGLTWSNALITWPAYLNDVTFVDATHGWTVGLVQPGYYADFEAGICVTSDGGATWARQQAPEGRYCDLQGVAFADVVHGWVVGYMGDYTGQIAATTDGGANWAWQDPGTGKSLHDVAALDASHAVAVGDGGVIVTTTDGGATWTLTGGFDPPVISVSGADNNGRYNHSLMLTVSATPVPPATSVSSITYALEGGSPVTVPGASATIPFAVDASTHANDGAHSMTYTVTDDIGHTPAASYFYFFVDTRKPSPKAPLAKTVRRGGSVTLGYRVLDTMPCDRRVMVTIRVKSPSGKVVKTYGPEDKRITTAQSWTFKVPRTWKRGTYRYYVYATDSAGNKQAKVASNTLTVK